MCSTREAANRFLRGRYIKGFNDKFTVRPEQLATAFRRATRSALEWIFSVQTERVAAKRQHGGDLQTSVADQEVALSQ